MREQTFLRSMIKGIIPFIVLAAIEELIVYYKVYITAQYSTLDVLLRLGVIAALVIGYVVPLGYLVVGGFVFLVSYFVWISTYAPLHVTTLLVVLFIPANAFVAAYMKSRIIRGQRIMERLDAILELNPQLDVSTELGNLDAFQDTYMKQSHLVQRYGEQYYFSMAMFQIEFLPLVQESLGSVGYAKLLLTLSSTIQGEIRAEDYKFAMEGGRFIILCPLSNQDIFLAVAQRVKQSMMDVQLQNKHGEPHKLVIRAGTINFDPESCNKYQTIDQVISALVRKTETDLIGEYI